MMYSHILITGGAGFVGSNLALAIRHSLPATRVTALDNLRRRGSELNFARLRDSGVAFVHGDVRCAEDLAAVTPAPELIIECSAEPSVLAGYGSSPAYLIRSNLGGCYECLELARRAHADFLFLSTSRIYPHAALNSLAWAEGDTRYHLQAEQTIAGASIHGVSEDFPLAGARSLYGMTKLAGELMIEEYGDAYGLRYVINRCGLITGPWQMARADQGVVALWVAAHHFGRPLRYIGFGGTGKQVRDFLHIDDLANLVLAQIRDIGRFSGRIFNVGGGSAASVSLREATDLCREITGVTVPVESSSEERPADIRIYLTDHRRVTGLSGWKPKRDARRTIGEIHNWIRKNEALVGPVLLSQLG